MGFVVQGLSPKTAAKAATFRVTRSSRHLQRSWRRFASQHKSSTQLAQEFAAQGVASMDQQQQQDAGETEPQQHQEAEEPTPTPGSFVMIGGVGSFKSSKHEPFEDFAKKLQSPATIKAAQVWPPLECSLPATNIEGTLAFNKDLSDSMMHTADQCKPWSSNQTPPSTPFVEHTCCCCCITVRPSCVALRSACQCVASPLMEHSPCCDS